MAYKQHFVLPAILLLILNIYIHCKLAFYCLSRLKILEINPESCQSYLSYLQSQSCQKVIKFSEFLLYLDLRKIEIFLSKDKFFSSLTAKICQLDEDNGQFSFNYGFSGEIFLGNLSQFPSCPISALKQVAIFQCILLQTTIEL